MKNKTWIWALPLVLALGCGEDEPTATTEEPTAEETTEEAGDPPPQADAEAGPLVDDPTFQLRLTAGGPYHAGEEGTFTLELTPKGEYHVNEDFPMAVRVAGPDGVTVPGELGNSDAEERTQERARFQVPFTAAAAGEHRVSCQVEFAVCTPETCMPDQRTVALLLPVE